jgi:ASC-1-like (ASCH) protein
MKLSQKPFDKISAGKKIIESRLFDRKRQSIKIGDIIYFSQKDGSAKITKAKVRALYRYNSFEDLFSDFPAQYFGGSSKKSLLKEINCFYLPAEQIKYGVVGIRIEI